MNEEISVVALPASKSCRSRNPDEKRRALRSDSLGQFWFEESHTVFLNGKRIHYGINNKEYQQLKELVKCKFFDEDKLRNVVIKLNDESSESPRLRAYDWAVTNYSKGNPQIIVMKKQDISTVVDPNLSYEGELRKHHRLLFDPFRRGTHIFFEMDGSVHRTTVGQLTFIKWCLDNEVDKYVEENLASIRQHMSNATKKQTSQLLTGKKRRELTSAPTKLVRGVINTKFNVSTDTPKELEARRTKNASKD